MTQQWKTGVAEQASMISCQPSPVAERKSRSSAWKRIISLPIIVGCSHLREGLEIVVPVYYRALSWFNLPKDLNTRRFQITKMFLTCMPTTPYMKKMMATKVATQGRAWKDLTKVKSRVRIPSPLESSLTTRRTRKRRKKETDIMFPGWREMYIDRLFESSPEVDSCRYPEETQ